MDPTAADKADKLAKIGLIVGAATILLSCLAGLPALILGGIAVRNASPKGRWKAIVAIVLGLASPAWPMLFSSSMHKTTDKQAADLALGKKQLEVKRAACAAPNVFRLTKDTLLGNAPQ